MTLSLPSRPRAPALRRAPARVVVLTALCSAVCSTWAQQATAPDLERVIVIGNGVEQRAFDTPYAVDVVGAEELRAGGLMVNLSESMGRVPGLTVNMRNNYAQDLQISSRGFGARSQFGVRGIRLYMDGIPAATPDGQGSVTNFDLAGAARIEVLRGPFSALYGNSSGGVISLITAAPKQRQVELGYDLGSNGTRQTRASFEAPLGGGFDLRLSGSEFETNGFRPQSAAKRWLGNARLGWQGERDSVVVLFNSVNQPAQDPLGLTRALFDANPDQTLPIAGQYDTRKASEQNQLGARWRHEFDNAGPLAESAVTAYQGRRSATQWQAIPVTTQASPRSPGGVIDFDRDYEGADARLVWRWTLGERHAQLITGATTERQVENRYGYENFLGTGPTQQLGVTGALRRQEVNSTQTQDVYAQGEIDVIPRVTATLGVRAGALKVVSTDAYLSNGDDSGHLRYSYTTPVAALQWKATPQINLYVSGGRGFESPTLTELAYRPDGNPGLNTDLKPQHSQQVEVGAKWRDPVRGMSVDVAVFRARTSDEIAVLTNSGGRSTYQNVGHTSRDGAEVGAHWQATKTLRAALALTYLDATYSDDFLTCAAAPCTTPVLPVKAGNRLAGTVKKNAFAEVAWAALPATEFAVEVNARGSIPVNDLNSDFAAGATVYNLRASHSVPLGSAFLDLIARVDDVADRRYAGSVIVNEANSRFFEPAAGRTWLVGVKMRYPF